MLWVQVFFWQYIHHSETQFKRKSELLFMKKERYFSNYNTDLNHLFYFKDFFSKINKIFVEKKLSKEMKIIKISWNCLDENIQKIISIYFFKKEFKNKFTKICNFKRNFNKIV
jgi:hypothetical protein